MFADWPAILQIIFFSSIPESVSILYFTLAFWGIPLQNQFRKFISVSAFVSSSFILNMVFVPDLWRAWVSIAAISVVIFAVFRKMPFRERMELAVTYISITFLLESIASWIPFALGHVNVNELQQDPPVKVVPYFFLGSLLVGAAAFVMDRKGFAPGKAVAEVLQQSKQRQTTGLLVILSANLVIAGILYYYSVEDQRMIASILVLLLSLLSTAAMIFSIRQISKTKNHDILTTQETYMKEIENLFTTIRGQRHDFLNHVQVIQAFVQRGKLRELERYVNELVGEITEINDVLQIGHPALAAIIKSKWIYALDRKIDFSFSFENMEKLGNGVRSVDYVKIIGNLLDNAIEEAMQQPEGRRWIKMHGWADDASIYFTISNPAQPLTEEQKFKIFSPGYTTKPDKGHSGLGLSIVHERVRFYKGSIDVTNDDSGRVLTFQVTLPLRRNQLSKVN